jgi:pre-mRNA-processing factor 19
MSLYHCAITGENLEEPVVSKRSGHIFEKKVIEKYLDANPTDPVSGQPLTKDDLVPLQVNKTIKPRSVTATSIPGMLTVLKNEWDGLMLEVYTLKQSLENTRQELSHALYQHDAACRVIARLIRERDEARNSVAQLTAKVAQIHADGAQASNGTSNPNLPAGVINQISETALQLNAVRKETKKNKQAFADYATKEMIVAYKPGNPLTVHTAALTSLDILKNQEKFAVAGAVDGAVILVDKDASKVIEKFTKHTKKISDVSIASKSDNGLLVVTASQDGTSHLAQYDFNTKKFESVYVANQHASAINSCTVHPTKALYAIGSQDGSFSYHSITDRKFLSKQKLSEHPITSIRFHPDGIMMGVGLDNGFVHVWNITENSELVNVKAGDGAVTQLSFSENGYSFATYCQGENVVKIWDLRNIGEETMKKISLAANFKVESIGFDHSGQFLTVAGTGLVVYDFKTLEAITTFKLNSGTIASTKFGDHSKYIAACSDKVLNIYA